MPLGSVSFTSAGADPELAAIERRRQLAMALQQQAAQPLQSQNGAPISPLSGLAKLLRSYTGGRGMRLADEQEQQYNTDYDQAVSGALQGGGTYGDMADRLAQSGNNRAKQLAMQLRMQQAALDADTKAKQVKQLTPEEVAADGYPQGAIVTRDAYNKPTLVFDPTKNQPKPRLPVIYTPEEMAQKKELALVRARAADKPPPAPTMKDIVDPKDPTRMISVDARTYNGGTLGDVGVLGVAGKEPSAAKHSEQVDAGRDTVSSLISGLRDVYGQLHESGGISDPDAGTMSNLMAGVGSSGFGQFFGRMTGTQNQSLRNQVAQQRPLLLQAIRQATGMSAKQMDSNAELKMYLAAATDPTLDYKANMAALEKLDQLYGLSGATNAGSTHEVDW